MGQTTITPDMSMERILEIAPAAQRALFQRYHVGGCSACGFQPSDTLAQVCKDHNILDVSEVIDTIHRADDVDRRCQAEPRAVKAWLDAGQDFSFIDVRPPEELAQARIPATEPLDFSDSGKYMDLPRDRRIVFACKDGRRSLDVASYFIGHGFTNVWSLRGGIEAWAKEVDAAVGSY